MDDKKQIAKNLDRIKKDCIDYNHLLVAVSKTKPIELLLEAYNEGIRDFGENKVQELVPKFETLPKDINWHFIGHLQSNKVKYIAPFVHLIHSVDSLKLLGEINKQGQKINKPISCLLQMYIADEETKFGLDESEAYAILENQMPHLPFVKIKGLMGMATFTDDEMKIRNEFNSLYSFFIECKAKFGQMNPDFSLISMGMSHDYKIALEVGSNMLRLGSTIFGERN